MSSVYFEVLDAVKTLVASISGLTATNQVVIRERLAFVKQVDSVILQNGGMFVCIAPGTEHINDSIMPNTDLVWYPVVVAIVQESAFSLINPDPILLLREQIRQKLRSPTLTGVSQVFNCVGYNPSPPISPEGFDASFRLSTQEFTWEAAETRNQ